VTVTTPPRFADIEALAVAYLRSALDVRVSTELPAKLEASLPMLRVTRGPGSDDKLNDRPLLDVEAFAADRAGMWSLADRARVALHDLAGRKALGRLVDTVETVTTPTFVDYENPAVRRAVATYRLVLRTR
jgi:hypothetical protein